MRGLGVRVPSPARHSTLRQAPRKPAGLVEGFPSGQREQTVNLSAYAFGGSNPPPSTISSLINGLRGNSSVARASAFQAEGRGFESRFPLQISPCRNPPSTSFHTDQPSHSGKLGGLSTLRPPFGVWIHAACARGAFRRPRKRQKSSTEGPPHGLRNRPQISC